MIAARSRVTTITIRLLSSVMKEVMSDIQCKSPDHDQMRVAST